MKKLTALILAALLTASVLASCGKDEPKDSSDTTPTDVDTQPNDETNPETTPAEEETKPAVDTSKMTDFAWSTATDTVVAALTFDGSNATFNVIENGVDKSVSGAYTATDDTLTIDGTELSWKVMASFCKITMGESTYSLSKSSDKDVAMGPYNLMKYTWSGDGATLSFADGKASIKIDGTDIDYNGTYTVNSADSIFIQDGAENSENLAIGATATASSVEAGVDCPGEYAIDGDYATRWASDYVDPSQLTIDLGSEKTVGGFIIYFEAAASGDYNIKVSTDGENYTSVVEATGNTIGASPVGDSVEHKIAPVTARYIQFEGLTRMTTYGHSIWEFEIYESIAGSVTCDLSYEGENIVLTANGNTYKLSK